MPKVVNRLSATSVSKLSSPRVYPDGRGLYLQVTETGAKSWLYRYERDGKGHWHGLGAYPTVTLAMARDKAMECRRLRDQGVDPIENSRGLEAERRTEANGGMTFRECAHAHIEAHAPGWKNAKHAAQWTSTLETYAFPVLGSLRVQDIDVELVLKVLEPIWHTKTETATRVRQRLESVLDWATARAYRQGENPARWRGHLDKLLPKRSKVQKVEHHKAMPYAKLPAFFQALRKRDALSARALAFTILTACRSGEVRAATWGEVDKDLALWSIPGERMKAGREHRVPLTSEALAVLEEVSPLATQDPSFVFPGLRANRPLSDAAMRKFLQEDLGHPGLTVHGFRSSFRDWCAERTSYPRELAEAALAHVLRDKTESAYQRGDMVERRRELMEAWQGYLMGREGS